MSAAPEGLTILWIDHDADIQTRLDKIGSMRNIETLETVAQCCTFLKLLVAYAPPTETSAAPLAVRVEEAIKNNIGNGFDAIMVDLSFGPHDDPGMVKVGARIAKYLQPRFPTKAIGIYTRSVLSLTDRASFCSSGFDIVLEDFDRMIANEYGKALPAESWVALFGGAVTRARQRATAFPTVGAFSTPNLICKWAPGQPKSTSQSFSRFAPALVAKALKNIPNLTTVSLNQLGGGFSGSYLVKAEPQGGQKHFVVKIDESPERLRREIAGYNQMGAFLSQRYFIKPEGEPVVLSEELWGAFAMEYDGLRRPIVECEPLESFDLEVIFTTVWKECLLKAYGRRDVKATQFDAILGEDRRRAARSSVASWQRYLNRARLAKIGALAWIEKGVEWLAVGADTSREGLAITVPWVERVHGDLNCRNIFYSTETKQILLIDFPNVRPGPLATDFVKAEIELVIVMMDRASGQDCEFARIDTWMQLTEALAEGLKPGIWNLCDCELQRIAKPLGIIRNVFADEASGMGADSCEAYRQALVARLLTYLGYPDITPAKKLLALCWIGQMMHRRKW